MALQKARLEAAQAERRCIARELHDTLSQSLTGIVLQLEATQDLVSENAAAATHIQRALEAARNAFSEMRRALDHLCPEALEKENLPKALARLGKELADGKNLEVQMSVAGEACRLPPEIETALLRIGQEALANIVRHACARHAWMTLRFAYRNVFLCVKDDGKGFRAGLHTEGFGLRSMEERTRLLGGTWTLQTELGGGTQISVSIPVR